MKRTWLGGPQDGGEIDVPEDAKTLRYPLTPFNLSVGKMPEPGDVYDSVECKVTSKYVIWPYPGKEKANG